jgi:hypothetical protein
VPLYQLVTEVVGDLVDHDDGDEEQKEDRHHFVIAALTPLHRNLQIAADAALTNEAWSNLSIGTEDIWSNYYITLAHIRDIENRLDAMENPYTWSEDLKHNWLARLKDSAINRYPDPQASELTATLKKLNQLYYFLDSLLLQSHY